MLIVDNTILSSVQTCSTQAAVRHVLGLVPARDDGDVESEAPKRAGHAAHRAFETWLKGGTVAAALDAFDADYREWATRCVPADHRLSIRNVSRILQRWFSTQPAVWPVQVDPRMVEIPLAVPLAPDVLFVARLDAAGRDLVGYHVVETKTTGSITPWWEKKHRMAAQITGYIWATEQTLGVPVVGALINAIEFGRLPGTTKNAKCREHGVMYDECTLQHATFKIFRTQRTPNQIEAWRQTAMKLAERYRVLQTQVTTLEDVLALPMEGQFVGACPWCPFANYCGMGRPAQPAMFRSEPWDPLSGPQ